MKRSVQRAWSAMCSHRCSRWRRARPRNPKAQASTSTSRLRVVPREQRPGHQAPKTSVLKQMTPERILEVMTTGSMRNAASR